MATQEEVLSHIRVVAQGLESLQSEHKQILSGLEQSASLGNDLVTEKVALMKKSAENIDLAIGEAHVVLSLAAHLHHLEAQKGKLRSQVQRLNDENGWLREELTEFQQRWQCCQEECAVLHEEKEHLQFMLEVKKYDDTPQTPMDSEKIRLDLGFPEQEEESHNGGGYDNSCGGGAPRGGGDRLRTLINLVVQYASSGRYEVAVPLCKQTISDLERTSGHEHPDVATMLNILACVYRDQGKMKEATDLLIDALDIRERTLGTDHQAVAATLNNLAVLYCKRNRFTEAESLCKRALNIREKLLGKEHPDVAKQLNNLALICMSQNKFSEVEGYYRRALEVIAYTLGVDNANYHKTKNNLVEKHYTSALGIYEALSPPDDINVVKTQNSLASAYMKQNKVKQAELLYKQIIDRAHQRDSSQDEESKPIWMTAEEKEENKDDPSSHPNLKSLSMQSPSMAMTLRNLSLVYRRQGRTEAADTIEAFSKLQATKTTERHKDARATYPMHSCMHDYSSEELTASQLSLDKTGDGQSSFSKLRQSLARGRIRLVQRLTGTDRMKEADSQDDLQSSGACEMQPITSLIGNDDFIM